MLLLVPAVITFTNLCPAGFSLCIEMQQRGISRDTSRFQRSRRLSDLFLDIGN